MRNINSLAEQLTMDDKIPTINMVVYLVANVAVEGKTKKHHFLGGHGYTYDVAQEGKKKLAKDVPTSTGYYTGNPQKANTVVVVSDVLTLTVPTARSFLESLLLGLLEILKLANDQKQKNLCIVTPHKELELITKVKDWLGKDELKIGKHVVTEDERNLGELVAAQLNVVSLDKDRKIFFDFAGSAEGGMGNRDAQKQLDLAEVIYNWGFDKSPKLIIQSRKDYENPEVDFNKIVSATRWYFETNNPEEFFKEQDGYRVYGFGKVEPDKNYYGKLTPDVTYSRLYTKRPVALLDKLFGYTHRRIDNPDGYLSAGDLNQLVSKDVARLLDTVPAVPVKHQLVSPFVKQNGRPVLIELIKPVMMSYRIRDFLLEMDVVFQAFRKKDANNIFGHCRFYDITDLIYTKEVNPKGVAKLKVHPDFNQLRTTIKVPVEHPKAVKPVNILLSVGYDIPERNAFSSIEDPNIKVWAVTDTRNDKGLRFCTLVETEEFIYVHTSAIANLRVLTLAELGRKAE
jgi:hypothetical protein